MVVITIHCICTIQNRGMNKYQKELQKLKPWDEVQEYRAIGRGYYKIGTAGHGYMVVPKTDIYASIASKICDYGFTGELAYYLEEDSEQSAFMRMLKTKECEDTKVTHHASNKDNCPKCMDLWIERENKKATA